MKKIAVIGLFMAYGLMNAFGQQRLSGKKGKQEKTSFQTSGQWKPATDVRSDVSIVYGVNDRPNMTFEQRVQSWRDPGYETHFMTAIASGGYADYFTCNSDGINHLPERQLT